MSRTEEPTDVADRVRVSYRPVDDEGVPVEEDDYLGESVRADTFRTYLRRAHAGPVGVGDEWAEFVNCGCGTTEDVHLHVEAVEGGSAIGETTDVVVESV
ncbi:MAG: hypothetical protein V5A44_09015 [Haloarculaceae archaeon]